MYPNEISNHDLEARLQSFSHFIARFLPGKIQKITVNSGFSCPNRDGSKGRGGCSYCNNASFTPAYALTRNLSITTQIEQGKNFFSHKYPDMRYLAYFQSYTSTNTSPSKVIDQWNEALSVDKVDGIIIGTRPDCMPDCLIDELARISASRFVMVEFGAETASDATLGRINRRHTWADTVDAVMRTTAAGIPVGLHFILGLPGETRADILDTIDRLNKLPIDTVKFHQMQVIKGTPLAREFQDGTADIADFTPESYAELCIAVLRKLRTDITVERFISQSPPELLIHPRWGLKNYQFVNLLRKKLAATNAK